MIGGLIYGTPEKENAHRAGAHLRLSVKNWSDGSVGRAFLSGTPFGFKSIGGYRDFR